MAVCALVANILNTGSNRGSCKPLQKGWKKKEKKEPCRIGHPPLSFGEFIRAHPQGCFVCYGRRKGFNHDHRTCPVHKADTEAYKEVHGSKKRAPAGIRETKVEVIKDKLPKLMSVGTELAKAIQEIKRFWVPKSDNKNKENKEKDKDKKGKKGGKKKSVNEGDAATHTAAHRNTGEHKTSVPGHHTGNTSHTTRAHQQKGAKRPRRPRTRHHTQSLHTGEPEPRGPGHRTQDTAHQSRHTGAQEPSSPGRTRTQHRTQSVHAGEQEPSGPRHRIHNTTHRACTPVNRSQEAQDTVHATTHTERAHR